MSANNIIVSILLSLLLANPRVRVDAAEVDEDWLGSRAGLLVGADAKDFIATTGIAHQLSRITIRLKRRKDGENLSDSYSEFETWCEIVADDKAVLELATTGLRRSRWSPQVPGTHGYGTVPFGEIIFESNRGRCRVFLDPIFVLDDGPGCYDSNHAFESWTLARLAHELLRQKLGKGLTEDQFGVASGEKRLASERLAFEKKWQAKKEK